ncbi:MAG: T9SS type A sorting domain-containing protein [Candidatus Delongbacteria bacterium]|jgi:thiol-disulfide isomerase/thioredoxin|nr:T9SS type A sorting domain-containing protein [Candidatus Delongbacteria bacterium]
MRYIVLIAGLLLAASLHGQKIDIANDFGLISEYGDTMYLQEDLLDQDKTVVLAFFRPYCAPCADAVLTLNNIYNTYGQNTENVYLWAICNELYPYSAINQFEEDNSTEYDCWALTEEDSVVDLYEVYLVPKYVVICPNGLMSEFELDSISGAVDNCLLVNNQMSEADNKPELISFASGIHFRASNNGHYDVKIYNLSGQLVFHDRVYNNTKLDFHPKHGIYMYHISDRQGKHHSGRIFY